MVATTEERVRCFARPRSVWSACQCPTHTAMRNYARRQQAYGRYDRVTVEEAMTALDEMLAQGYDSRAIASAMPGIPEGTVRHWTRTRRRGEMVKVGPAMAQAIIEHGTPTDGNQRGPGPIVAKRKLRALTRLGWPIRELAVMMVDLGLTETNRSGMLFDHRAGRRPVIDVKLLRAIDALYRRLEMSVPPDTRAHTRARNYAIRRRWASPLAWNNIENPLARTTGSHSATSSWDHTRHHDSVDEIAVWRATRGDKGLSLTRGEKVAVVNLMRRAGRTDADIETITGISRVTVNYPREVAVGNDS